MIYRNMKTLTLLLTICLVFNQDNSDLDLLRKNAESYYNIRDYSNAIILFEDLLAKQEALMHNYDPQIAETLNKLGEMYSILGNQDIADYYYDQAILILENSLKLEQKQSETLLKDLLNIYTLKNDFNKISIIENKLFDIASLFQFNNIDSLNMLDLDDSTYYKEDLAFDSMNKGLSYLENGLYTEAALEFNSAFNFNSKNIDLQFLSDFFPKDSLIDIQMSKAFKFQLDINTSNSFIDSIDECF